MNFPDNIEALVRHPLIASAAGALVGMNFIPGRSLLGRITNVFGGMCVAVFVGPLLFDWLSVKNLNAMSGLSFMLGMLGMSMADSIIKGISEAQVGAAINDRIRRSVPPPPPSPPPPTTEGEKK